MDIDIKVACARLIKAHKANVPKAGDCTTGHAIVSEIYPCNASCNLSSSAKAITYSVFDDSPSPVMPIPLNEPSSAPTRYDVADFEKPKPPQDESSFSRTMERIFLSGSLFISFYPSIFVDPSPIPSFAPLCPIVAAGVARIYPRRGESHPLKPALAGSGERIRIRPF